MELPDISSPKPTLAAELKAVLDPEFLSPADNRPQIRDAAMFLTPAAVLRKKQITHCACVRGKLLRQLRIRAL